MNNMLTPSQTFALDQPSWRMTEIVLDDSVVKTLLAGLKTTQDIIQCCCQWKDFDDFKSVYYVTRQLEVALQTLTEAVGPKGATDKRSFFNTIDGLHSCERAIDQLMRQFAWNESQRRPTAKLSTHIQDPGKPGEAILFRRRTQAKLRDTLMEVSEIDSSILNILKWYVLRSQLD
jgi:hypothetical protein